MTRLTSGLATALMILSASLAHAGNVTPDVIFGTGNPNGGWTIDQSNSIEVGLRGKTRFGAVLPNNAGVYQAVTGTAAGVATWNYEFAVNVDYGGTTGATLDEFIVILEIDTDPTSGVSYFPLDIFATWPDNALGTNATGNGGGVIDPTNLHLYNVAQNSQNLSWTLPATIFNPNKASIWDFQLTVYDALDTGLIDPLAQTSIQVVATPEPSSMVLLGIGVAGLAGYGLRRRKQRQSAA